MTCAPQPESVVGSHRVKGEERHIAMLPDANITVRQIDALVYGLMEEEIGMVEGQGGNESV